MARMPGRASQSWCPSCCGPPGPDCPDVRRSPRQIRRQLQRERQRIADALTCGPELYDEFGDWLAAVNDDMTRALDSAVDTEAGLRRIKGGGR